VDTITLTSPDKEIQREVEATPRGDGVFAIKDENRYVYLTLSGEGDLRVDMVDEERNSILTDENDQPNRDIVTATLQTD
jgi:hypothetical protein